MITPEEAAVVAQRVVTHLEAKECGRQPPLYFCADRISKLSPSIFTLPLSRGPKKTSKRPSF